MQFIEKLLREYPSMQDMVNDRELMFWLTLGKSLIAIFFTSIGFYLVMMAGSSAGEPREKKKLLAQLFGLTFIFCGLSRSVEALSVYHNLAYLDACLSIGAGITAVVVMCYLPLVTKAIKKQATLNKIRSSLNTSTEQLKEVKEITEKLNKNGK